MNYLDTEGLTTLLGKVRDAERRLEDAIISLSDTLSYSFSIIADEYSAVRMGNLLWTTVYLRTISGVSSTTKDNVTYFQPSAASMYDSITAQLPAGWRIPTKADWGALVSSAGGMDTLLSSECPVNLTTCGYYDSAQDTVIDSDKVYVLAADQQEVSTLADDDASNGEYRLYAVCNGTNAFEESSLPETGYAALRVCMDVESNGRVKSKYIDSVKVTYSAAELINGLPYTESTLSGVTGERSIQVANRTFRNVSITNASAISELKINVTQGNGSVATDAVIEVSLGNGVTLTDVKVSVMYSGTSEYTPITKYSNKVDKWVAGHSYQLRLMHDCVAVTEYLNDGDAELVFELPTE